MLHLEFQFKIEFQYNLDKDHAVRDLRGACKYFLGRFEKVSEQ